MTSSVQRVTLGCEGDAVLMRRLAAGSDAEKNAALVEIYARHGRYLRARIANFYRRSFPVITADVDEIFQETILRVVESAHTFTVACEGDTVGERRQLRAWMGRLAENLIKDDFRSRRLPQVFRPVAIDEVELAQEMGLCSSSEQDDDDSPQMRLLVEALSSLNDKEQAVIRLCWLEKDPQNPHARLRTNVTREIASHLGTTPENVRKILQRATEKIRKYIADSTQGAAHHGE